MWLGAVVPWFHALKRAGIENFRFHDLRHTWASWHVQNGTPIFALQELGGWMTEKMVRRYAHLAADHLAAYVGNVNIHGTFLAHPVLIGHVPGTPRLRLVAPRAVRGVSVQIGTAPRANF
jgi:hypothetical protein